MAESDKRCSLKAVQKKMGEKRRFVFSFLTFFVESIKRTIVDRNDDRHELSLFPNRVSGERNRPFICNSLELGRRETRSRTSGKRRRKKKSESSRIRRLVPFAEARDGPRRATHDRSNRGFFPRRKPRDRYELVLMSIT